MSLQLQQNLYSIYRLCLKLPTYIFIGSLIILLFLAASQLLYIARNQQHMDVSLCLLDYVIQKNARISAQNMTENSTQIKNQILQKEYLFLDQKTLINIEFGSSPKCKYAIDYPFQQYPQTLPLMKIVQNEQLAYLGNKSQKYLKQHGITYDKIVLPERKIEYPFFFYYLPKEMVVNQLVIQSLRKSFFNYLILFELRMMKDNITDAKFKLTELYLTFYSQNQAAIYHHTMDLIQFFTLKTWPSYLLKLIFAFSSFGLLFIFSIFVGLFVRYTLIFAYTVFLIFYDKCMKESWGWVHAYLTILYNRLRQNGTGVVKMFIFYVVSNLGMNFLLAFGAYCIIKKILYPIFPTPVDSYTDFFFKTIFCVQVFLYVFCRSRTALRFFPILSFIVSYITLLLIYLRNYGNIITLLNLCLSLQLILMVSFLLVQQSIINQNQKGLTGYFCPSMNKPRMLFYAGYDISWEKSLPPIWTYFTDWFDYSYFSEAEKCVIQKDYQLLYGRLLGLNDRQEIPQLDEDQQERNRMLDQPSNQMNLIQNDV